MADEFGLDTHAVIWYLEANPRLGRQARAILDALGNSFVLPVIALAEAVHLVERGRTGIPSVSDLFTLIDADRRIRVVPLSAGTVRDASHLTAVPEIHDRLIVATMLRLQQPGRAVPLLTRDADIVRSGLIPTVW